MARLKAFKNRLISSKLISDSFWSLTGNVIGRGLSLLAGILVARFLGKDIFGEYGIIKTTILSVAMFSTFGLGYTATKFVADFKINNKEKLYLFVKYANRITLIISGSMALGFFVFSPQIAHILNASHLINSFRILSVLVVFNALTTTQIGVIAGLGKFKDLAKVNAIVGGLNFLLSVVLTFYWDLTGALVALLITQIINWFFNHRLVQGYVPIITNSIHKDKLLFKEIINFSSPVALQEAFYSIISWLTSYLLVFYANYGELGMYNAAIQWNVIILFIPGILRNVILSHLSENTNNPQRHSIIIKQTLFINFTVTFLMASAVFLLSDIITTFYGKSFIGLSSLISIAVFATIFSSMSNVYIQAYMSKGKNWEMLFIRILRGTGLILAFILLQNYFDMEKVRLLIILGLISDIVFLIIMALFYKRINSNYTNGKIKNIEL